MVVRLVRNETPEITLESMRGRLKIVGDFGEPADPHTTQTVSAAEFVQNCAAFLDTVNKVREVVIEKDGQTIARLVATGPMYGTVLFEGDIMSPVTDPEDWTADEENVVPPHNRP